MLWPMNNIHDIHWISAICNIDSIDPNTSAYFRASIIKQSWISVQYDIVKIEMVFANVYDLIGI